AMWRRSAWPVGLWGPALSAGAGCVRFFPWVFVGTRSRAPASGVFCCAGQRRGSGGLGRGRVTRRPAMPLGFAGSVLPRPMGGGMLTARLRLRRNRGSLPDIRGGGHVLAGEGGRVCDPGGLWNRLIGKVRRRV